MSGIGLCGDEQEVVDRKLELLELEVTVSGKHWWPQSHEVPATKIVYITNKMVNGPKSYLHGRICCLVNVIYVIPVNTHLLYKVCAF